MNRRIVIASVAVGAVVVIGAVSVRTDVLSGAADTSLQASAAPVGTETATVRRGDLSATREFNAKVSFGDPWTINAGTTGTITAQHPAGTIVNFGEQLVSVDAKPLFLARGGMPMYRELEEVDRSTQADGTRSKLMAGYDVAQLQQFLLEAGFNAGGRLKADGTFAATTTTAVKAWQKSVGLAVTGRVDNTQLVFSPEPLRIASAARVGAAFGNLEVHNATPSVLVDTSNRDRAFLPVGAAVEVEFPDGTKVAGTVAKQEQVTDEEGQKVWRTTVTVTGDIPSGVSSATVTVTEVGANDVLTVPVGALLALAEGGFAVEVSTGPDTKLVAVDVGKVLDGRAEITGNIKKGDKVVVPA